MGGGQGGTKLHKIVIGTSTTGATANDVDYLCNGTNDDTIIRQAIEASTENDVIYFRRGTYTLTSNLSLEDGHSYIFEGEYKNFVTIKGSTSITFTANFYNNYTFYMKNINISGFSQFRHLCEDCNFIDCNISSDYDFGKEPSTIYAVNTNFNALTNNTSLTIILNLFNCIVRDVAITSTSLNFRDVNSCELTLPVTINNTYASSQLIRNCEINLDTNVVWYIPANTNSSVINNIIKGVNQINNKIVIPTSTVDFVGNLIHKCKMESSNGDQDYGTSIVTNNAGEAIEHVLIEHEI